MAGEVRRLAAEFPQWSVRARDDRTVAALRQRPPMAGWELAGVDEADLRAQLRAAQAQLRAAEGRR